METIIRRSSLPISRNKQTNKFYYIKQKIGLIFLFISFGIINNSCNKLEDEIFSNIGSGGISGGFNINQLQTQFDSYGSLPETKSMVLNSGKILYYTDTRDGDKVILSITGSGGDAVSYYMFEHLRTLRRQLGFRIISVEKNGLGSTPHDPNWTAEEYGRDCQELLNRLGINKVILFSQSAGGLLITRVAQQLGNARVQSIHLGNSVANYDAQDPVNGFACAIPVEQLLSIYAFWTDPATNYTMLLGPRDLAVVNALPGLPNLFNYIFRNAVRSGSMRWLEDEVEIGCPGYPIVSNITAPIYIYHGTEDPIVLASIYVDKWKYVFPNASKSKMRIYKGEEHLSFLRNFEQVLLDMAGLDNKVILNKNGHNLLVDESAVNGLLQNGAVRGIVAWSKLDGK